MVGRARPTGSIPRVCRQRAEYLRQTRISGVAVVGAVAVAMRSDNGVGWLEMTKYQSLKSEIDDKVFSVCKGLGNEII